MGSAEVLHSPVIVRALQEELAEQPAVRQRQQRGTFGGTNHLCPVFRNQKDLHQMNTSSVRISHPYWCDLKPPEPGCFQENA